MNISEVFIRRPIATSLLMAAIALCGIVAYRALPVSDLPAVDFPTLLVTASLPGANPDTMASSVATPLERQFSTIAVLDQMTSASALGTTQITLQFALSRNIDAAAQDVQAAITAAGRTLPPELPTPPVDAQLLDVRPVDDHLAGHRPGALNVPVSGSSFSTKAATAALAIDGIRSGRPVAWLGSTMIGR